MSIQASDEAMDVPVLGKASASVEPRQGAFDGPAACRTMNFPVSKRLMMLIDSRSMCATVASNFVRHIRHRRTASRVQVRLTGPLDQAGCAVAVLNIGTMLSSMLPSVSVTMWRLHPFYLLAGVVSAYPRDPPALVVSPTIDEAAAGLRLPAFCGARPCHQHLVDGIQQAAVGHSVEMYCTVVKGGKSLGNCPLASRRGDILDRVPQIPGLVPARTTYPGPAHQQRADDSPFSSVQSLA